MLRPRWHMRHIPRPSGGSFVRGDKRLMETKAPGWILGEQFRKLGPVIRTDASLSVCRLGLDPNSSHSGCCPEQMPRFVTMDKRALHHILITHPLEFPKSTMLKRMLGRIAGEGTHVPPHLRNQPPDAFGLGLLTAEGATHARQRKVMVCSKLILKRCKARYLFLPPFRTLHLGHRTSRPCSRCLWIKRIRYLIDI